MNSVLIASIVNNKMVIVPYKYIFNLNVLIHHNLFCNFYCGFDGYETKAFISE